MDFKIKDMRQSEKLPRQKDVLDLISTGLIGFVCNEDKYIMQTVVNNVDLTKIIAFDLVTFTRWEDPMELQEFISATSGFEDDWYFTYFSNSKDLIKWAMEE